MAITNTTRASGDELSYANAYWGIDIGSTGTFVDVSEYGITGSANTQSVDTTEEKLFQGSSIVATSAVGNVSYTFTGLVTEAATELFRNIELEWRAAANSRQCDFKICHRDPQTGDMIFTSSGGKITDFTYPTIDANSAESGRFTFTITAGSLVTGTEA